MEHKIYPNSLALFDFDGTLTTKDSFIEFIKYYHGAGKLLWGLSVNAPELLLYKIGLIPNWKAKENLMVYFFKGADLETFNQRARDFSLHIIPKMLRLEAVKYLDAHKKAGNDVYLVSASFQNWLQPWAEAQGIKVISSQLESSTQKLTGKISGKNCYGPEKRKRIKTEINLGDYEKVYAYGDSRGDSEMLELADYAWYRSNHVHNEEK